MISLNTYEQIPLNWMFDNQPDLVREMMKSPKTLLEHHVILSTLVRLASLASLSMDFVYVVLTRLRPIRRACK